MFGNIVMENSSLEIATNTIKALNDTKNWPELISFTKKLRKKFPENKALSELIFETLIKENRIDEAKNELRIYAKKHKSDTWLKIKRHIKFDSAKGAGYFCSQNEDFYKNLPLSEFSKSDILAVGDILIQNSEFQNALMLYRRSLEIHNADPKILNSIGVIYKKLGNSDHAFKHFHLAFKHSPNDPSVVHNLGNYFWEKRVLDKANKFYARALELKPGDLTLAASLINSLMASCNWNGLQELKSLVLKNPKGQGNVQPFMGLSIGDAPMFQLKISSSWAEKLGFSVSDDLKTSFQTRQANKRISIAYVSADFFDHATLDLMRGLIREHDYEKFSINYVNIGSHYSEDFANWVDSLGGDFHDISRMTDVEAVKYLREQNLDIAIDLKGYTKGNRAKLFAARIAKLQINYLGYPGTMGMTNMDFIIADNEIIPENFEKYYSEKVLRLPNCYQPNDNQRQISHTITSKMEHGLPENSFVFCCFNQAYKITEKEFSIWVNLLKKVEGSVLWLLEPGAIARKNIEQYVRKHGLSNDKIIFAPKLQRDLHLERLKHADLILDCFVINAHTTASDALWAGVPVITMQGKQFAARVASSLLKAINLQELITHSVEEYEAIALDFASNKELQNDIKKKLSENLNSSTLFNTQLFTRDFEALLSSTFECCAGQTVTASQSF